MAEPELKSTGVGIGRGVFRRWRTSPLGGNSGVWIDGISGCRDLDALLAELTMLTPNGLADGEKSTARALRPLLRGDWTLFNDIGTGHGNIDHILVGPSGVFALESKRLAGGIQVESGKVIVRWHEDPEDGYENESIAGRARGAAFDLHARIAAPRPWVQAVVVLWGDFAQGSVEAEKVMWVRGDQLASALTCQPATYSGEALTSLTSRTREAVRQLREAASGKPDGGSSAED